jgi:malate dehydrogenase (oxaloacetate-decarboxylating)
MQEDGCKNIIVTDSRGAIYENRIEGSGLDNPYKKEISINTNPERQSGSLGNVLKGADVFIGVSGKGNIISKDMIQSMEHDPIVFALSNPDPEILPSDALEGGARIVATGRSDFVNQVNNAVVFPSVLRALLDLRIRTLSEDMLVAVATAIADIVDSTHLKNDYIIPKVDDPRIIHIVTRTLGDAIQKHIDKKRSQQQ